MKKTNAIITSLGILALAAVLIFAFYFVTKSDNDERFLVSGSGTVYAKADIANLTVGLKTERKKTAAEATSENTLKMNNIIQAVKDLGVLDKDIKTTNYRLSPVYNWTENEGQELVGYDVSQDVTLKVRDLESISLIIAETTKVGANQVGNINFTIDDEFELKNDARELAIIKAKEKAALIANQSGLKLGEIKGVTENSYQPVDYGYTNAKLEYASDQVLSMESGPSIEAGQNEIRVDVTLSYEVK